MAEKLIIDWKKYNLTVEKLALQIHSSGYIPDLLIFVSPSTKLAISSPNIFLISFIDTEVSSTVSCNKPETIEEVSSFISVKIFATSKG